MLKLSISDVIVSQKRFQWRWKATFLWAGLYFTRSLCAKILTERAIKEDPRKFTPLYEKDI